ncbi:hypothetical protein OG905_32020 [Streptomyces sp. NBC_00322]|uniref:hypothetical protein n=1 Tax=Streptomyces sp. NBC_00322 TaxID=2975712 RepID=UPI002E294AC5|nr:hypothetical protein [Streptomyces sp. NBC_00322]
MTTDTERRTPRADCLADAAGAVTFDLAGIGASDAELVLRRRGCEGEQDETRLPLTPSGDGTSRAVLPGTVELAEGHWDAYAGDRPVESGIRDVRALLDRTPDTDRIAPRVPYPTAGGSLALRCWVRAPHAEAGDIGVVAEHCAMTVEGRLYGTEVGEGAAAEARLRGGDLVHRVPATGKDGAFGFTLPFAPLAEASGGKDQWWDLWLVPAAGAAAVRVSRVLDDVWDRRNVFVYPKQRTETGQFAEPCYTVDNDLCVRLTAAR